MLRDILFIIFVFILVGVLILGMSYTYNDLSEKSSISMKSSNQEYTISIENYKLSTKTISLFIKSEEDWPVSSFQIFLADKDGGIISDSVKKEGLVTNYSIEFKNLKQVDYVFVNPIILSGGVETSFNGEVWSDKKIIYPVNIIFIYISLISLLSAGIIFLIVKIKVVLVKGGFL
jgi:hypothetical protein